MPKQQFPESHEINRDGRLMECEDSPQPADTAMVSSAHSNPILHRVSVDLESTGTKKSVYGQATSQSMAPSRSAEQRADRGDSLHDQGARRRRTTA